MNPKSKPDRFEVAVETVATDLESAEQQALEEHPILARDLFDEFRGSLLSDDELMSEIATGLEVGIRNWGQTRPELIPAATQLHVERRLTAIVRERPDDTIDMDEYWDFIDMEYRKLAGGKRGELRRRDTWEELPKVAAKILEELEQEAITGSDSIPPGARKILRKVPGGFRQKYLNAVQHRSGLSERLTGKGKLPKALKDLSEDQQEPFVRRIAISVATSVNRQQNKSMRGQK